MTYFEFPDNCLVCECCTFLLPSGTIPEMNKHTEFLSESVDDLPLLIGLMKALEVPQILDRCVVTNGNHKGLSRGNLFMVWLTFILSQGDHRKSSVQEWVAKHKTILQALLNFSISDSDFTDDRLGLLLHSLSKDAAWEKIEDEWWQTSLKVISPNNGLRAVRLDATTVSGYHQRIEDGLMQLGNSKAHRPDLAQFKLMSAAHQPSGRMIANDILPGNSADDPLYMPIIRRTKTILGAEGVLFLGDCKMAALETRAQIVVMGDYFMTPLPLTGKTKDLQEALVTYALQHPGKVEMLRISEEDGFGFEHIRPMETLLDGKPVKWNERLFLVQFADLLERQQHSLEERLTKAQKALSALTPEPGRGKRVFRKAEELQAAILEILVRHDVAGLLEAKTECRETRTTKFVGSGRGTATRPTEEIVDTRFFVQTVTRVESAIEGHRQRLGWRIFATNMPAEMLNMTQGIREYRKGWGLERNFHILKEQPLGISPLFVQNDDQIIGLTRLLLLGNRVMSEIELRVRSKLKGSQETIAGLYAGLPKKDTANPTATKLLQKVVQAGVSLICMKTQETISFHLANLSPFVEKLLNLLDLNIDLYCALPEFKNVERNSRER